MNPVCIYGITKASGVHCCRFYRETHGIFAATGILYNHESIYRQEKFVSQKDHPCRDRDHEWEARKTDPR